MLLPHLAWHVATLNGHGGPEEEEEDTNLDGRREGMRIQIAANNLIVNNSPKSADQASYSCFPTSSMDQDVAAVSTLPRQLETSNKKSSQSTFQRISLNSAARLVVRQDKKHTDEDQVRDCLKPLGEIVPVKILLQTHGRGEALGVGGGGEDRGGSGGGFGERGRGSDPEGGEGGGGGAGCGGAAPNRS
eukprot:758910-Hanusia_phi.AAC.2